MASLTPFDAYARAFTSKLRARMHNQSFANTVMEENKHRLTAAGQLSLRRIDELVAMRKTHQKTFDPSLKVKAQQLLRTLPLMSVDEDPKFVFALRTLRCAAYFDTASSSTTWRLLNHLTKHAYLLDGFCIYRLILILQELQHSQSQEVIDIVLPRLREVSNDVTAVEASMILRTLHHYRCEDAVVKKKLGETIRLTIAGLTMGDATRCIEALPLLEGDMARQVIESAEPKLCEWLEIGKGRHETLCGLRMTRTTGSFTVSPGSATDNAEMCSLLLRDTVDTKELLTELCRCLTLIGWAPRRLLNSMARSALVLSNPLEPSFTDGPMGEGGSAPPHLSRQEMCFLMKLYYRTSYRHEKVLKVLASRVAALPSSSSSNGSAPLSFTLGHTIVDLTTAIESLAFFYLTDTVPVVLSMVDEVLDCLRDCRLTDDVQNHPAVLDALSRLLMSLVRLRFVPHAAAEGDSNSIRVAEEMCTCGVLHRYAQGSASLDVHLTARLLFGVVQITAQMRHLDSFSSASESVVSEVIGGLLTGLTQQRDSTRLAKGETLELVMGAVRLLEVESESYKGTPVPSLLVRVGEKMSQACA